MDKLSLFSEALKYKSEKNLSMKNPSLYNEIYFNNLLEESYQYITKCKQKCWTKEIVEYEFKKITSKKDLWKNHNPLRIAMKRFKLKHLITTLESEVTIWDYSSLQKEALKYKTRKEFQLEQGGAYHCARKMDILDDICSHMPYPAEYTDEEIIKVLRSYNNFTDLYTNDRNIFYAAQHRGIYKEHTKHYVNDCRSKYEVELKNFLISLGIPESSIEENNRKVISPYELDLFVKDKQIAIEYNGLKWHSILEQDTDDKTKNIQDSKMKNKHLKKRELCDSLGIRLFQINGDEWEYKKDIWKSIIRVNLGIYSNKIHDRLRYG